MANHSDSCWHAFQTAYIQKSDGKFNVAPCCRAKYVGFTDKIANIKNLPEIKRFRQKWLQGKKPQECVTCFTKEKAGVESKRQRSIQWFDNYPIDVDANGHVNHSLRDWDLRPENTCNLKCLMCNPGLSSKWNEDIDLYAKYFGSSLQLGQSFDWDYVYEHTKDFASRIYIAGGEPFYMKKAIQFLDRLSTHEYNRKNTRIAIQTNGTILHENLYNILKRFKKFAFSMSVDGVGDVDNLIRYPGNFDEKYKIFNKYRQISYKPPAISLTVQALNLPDCDNIRKTFPGSHISANLLTDPNILSINALKPKIVKRVQKKTRFSEIRQYCRLYKYREDLNLKMQEYLLDMDQKRGTDSKKVLPWCFI